MVLQNNEALFEEIKRVGCLFLSLMRIAELEANVEFTPPQINAIWSICKVKRHLDRHLVCKNPDGVIKEFFYLAGKPKITTIAQVGIEKQGKRTYWEWAKKVYEDYSYKIEKVKTYGEIGTHFRLCDKQGELIYDSYSFKPYELSEKGMYLNEGDSLYLYSTITESVFISLKP